MKEDRVFFDISIWTIVKVVAVILAFKFIIAVQDIILLFFIVLILVAALSPIVDRWSKKMNRVLAISLLYLLIMAIISVIILIVFPPFISQLQELMNNLPQYTSANLPFFKYFGIGNINVAQDGLSTVTKNLSNYSPQIFSATVSFVTGVVGIFTIIVLSFYLLLEQHGAKKLILSYLPIDDRETVVDIAQKIGNKMGAWMRGQLLLGLIIGVVDGVGLALLGVPFVLPLAIWAGFTELIPYVGPIIGAIPAIFIAFTVSPLIGILTLALYVVVQQLESNFLVPKIMQRAVGLSPVIIILALLVGAKLAGLLGVLLGIPTAVIISVLFEELPNIRQTVNRQLKKQA